MAIQISHTSADTVVHESAYAKVVNVQVIIDQARAEIGVHIYHNQAARNANAAFVERIGYSVLDEPADPSRSLAAKPNWTDYFVDGQLTPSDKSPVAQAYVYLKATQSIYAGGTDV